MKVELDKRHDEVQSVAVTEEPRGLLSKWVYPERGPETMDMSERRPNKWWTESDTFAMLALIEQLDLVHELDKKRQRNDSHFRRLRYSLGKRDIHFTVNQIRNRWKSLKHKYRKIKTAGYRSPAARLSAIESFRYFRMLDRMLARRARAGISEPSSVDGHSAMVLTPSDLEDHTDDVAQPGSVVPWQDSFTHALGGEGEETNDMPEEAIGSTQGWTLRSEEIMTLGLSGEYLYSVKSEPRSEPSLHDDERPSDPTSCSPEEQTGNCEDTSTLILQQLTILNHQLGEQLAEQRAFHCSMLGMMDRQIEVLEQLSNFSTGRRVKTESDDSDTPISQQVHNSLLRILRGVEHVQTQAHQPCSCKASPSQPKSPSWTVSLLEVHKGSPSRDGNKKRETSNPQLSDHGGGMADDVLFEFLHMEMVSHIYKEQASRGEMDKDRATCVSALESMGFRVGQGLIERFTKDSPSFKEDLDVMKFICKDFWINVFRKQIDNLRTNHQGTYVLQDNKFSLLTQLSSGKQYLEEAPKYLAYSCGLVRGALSNLGMDCVVTAEVSLMPSCKFQVVIQKA
ncbi:hypothetical protein DPEC_G00299480 [Dallia pectoralis]|uniref:Uncharacterized protein n=1 Tax=Dallia pectoralis TaxID=75939 RepID=A0ACC2FG66_DALPE|nr:hypothetical protein DPEC_G00299480 [Dallia pectoralis]